MGYSPEQIKKLEDGHSTVRGNHDELLLLYLGHRFHNSRAQEYATQGFSRRLNTLARCIDNVFKNLPPSRTNPPTTDERNDVEINIQAFVFNVFGAIDNLAWIWVSEKGVTKGDGTEISPMSVGLRKKNRCVRRSFSQEFQEYLNTRNEWFGYQEDYRHALGHRIPLYVPPYTVPEAKQGVYRELEDRKAEANRQRDYYAYDRLSAEQDALGVFTPWMKHSHEEGSKPVPFHAQMLADFNTVVELGQKMLAELDR